MSGSTPADDHLRRVQAELEGAVVSASSGGVWIAVTSALVSLLVFGSIALALTWPRVEGGVATASTDHGRTLEAQLEALGELERELEALRQAHAKTLAATEAEAERATADPSPIAIEPAPEKDRKVRPERPPRERRTPRGGADVREPASTPSDRRREPITFEGSGVLSDID